MRRYKVFVSVTRSMSHTLPAPVGMTSSEFRPSKDLSIAHLKDIFEGKK